MKLDKRGFTLIELMVTITVLLIVLGLVSGLVLFSTKFFRDENTQLSNQESIRMVTVLFEKDVRRYVVSAANFAIDSPCAVIKPDSNPVNDIWYCLNSGKLTRIESGNTQFLGDGIQDFVVSFNSSIYAVQLQITTNPDARGRTNDVNLNIFVRQGRAE